jgi:hypothetical protein
MLQRTILILAVCMFASPIFAQERVAKLTEKEIKAAEAARAREAEVKAALEKVIPAVNFSNATFEKAIDQIREASGANIFVNWRALELAGIAKDKSVNFKLRQVSVRKVIALLLSEAGDGKGLAWIIDDGVIYISTLDDINRKVQIRIYEVRDLLDPRQPDQKGEVLKMTITFSIAPDSWFEAGGTGTIRYIDGKLVISQTHKNHEAIENLLTGLRELRR